MFSIFSSERLSSSVRLRLLSQGFYSMLSQMSLVSYHCNRFWTTPCHLYSNQQCQNACHYYNSHLQGLLKNKTNICNFYLSVVLQLIEMYIYYDHNLCKGDGTDATFLISANTDVDANGDVDSVPSLSVCFLRS